MERIRVAIIDDNHKIRFIIKEVLRMEDDIELCEEADNMDKARQIVKDQKPDVLILDISLTDRNDGLHFLKEISLLSPETNTIVLSAHDESIYAAKSIEEGAKGYVCKDKTVRCLVDAIRAVHSGREFVSSGV